ncbi:hypothetical protein LXA43DRAFT_908109 [Ganoderma leucocontextum]|nr:hypothetical protein LXA43DRAFT_908109 [Ganoderma leucocontextum]
MSSTVRDLTFTLSTYFTPGVTLVRATYILIAVVGLWPLWQHHRRQIRDPRQRQLTAWSQSARDALRSAVEGDISVGGIVDEGLSEDEADNLAASMHTDLDLLYELLGVSPETLSTTPSIPPPPLILCTPRLECSNCNDGPRRKSLRRRVDPRTVKVLTSDLRWQEAKLYIAHCINCRADYYPDSWTYPGPDRTRRQCLEYDAAYIRVSKHGLWVERRVGWMQEHALVRFKSGWSNFATWINDLIPDRPLLTNRQSQRLFFEHFTRRLLVAHDQHTDFSLPAHSTSAVLALQVRELIGVDGGVLPTSRMHGCKDCTHVKQYHTDLIARGLVPDAGNIAEVAEIEEDDEDMAEQQPQPANELQLPPGMPDIPAPVQQPPPPGDSRGYIRLAVMDGKTITHQACYSTTKCALDDCRKPLVNYRNGRFCEDHLYYRDICGIIPCGDPVDPPGSSTCTSEAHSNWYGRWRSRFTRMSFPGVQRVIRRQKAMPAEAGGHRPMLNPQLPILNNTPGDQVVHVFRAQTTYCLETIQWACGMPIGWGKCYKSESSTQVLSILNNIWPQQEHDSRPGFIVFDDACDLLRHIVTQDPHDSWIESTKFIVDAWHYIGHKATDVLCRLWCNPAPKDGSQPDLIQVQEDETGRIHQVRAFNTETAEQFNAWLNGFEAQMRHMTDVNYDFFVHVLFLVYAELVEERMREKHKELDDEFWDQAEELM